MQNTNSRKTGGQIDNSPTDIRKVQSNAPSMKTISRDGVPMIYDQDNSVLNQSVFDEK